MSRVTVAISARNRPDLLRRALLSVRAQTYRDFEVLVSDNASSEDLRPVLAEFPDLRLRHSRHERILPMAESWRFALTEPGTPFVAWLHDDDYWLPDHLGNAVAALDAYPRATLFSCAVDHMTAAGLQERQIPIGLSDVEAPLFFSPAEAFPLWLHRHNGQCSALVFRREVFKEISWGPKGLYRTLDYWIAAQAALGGGWVYHPACTAHYWLHAGNDTFNNPRMLALWSVQSTWVIRALGGLAVRRGLFSEDRLVEALRDWNQERIETILLAFSLWSAEPRLRGFACRLIATNPGLTGATAHSRSCRLAARVGRWYLGVADYINLARNRWLPHGSQ